jgi:hypothetical protein
VRIHGDNKSKTEGKFNIRNLKGAEEYLVKVFLGYKALVVSKDKEPTTEFGQEAQGYLLQEEVSRRRTIVEGLVEPKELAGKHLQHSP